jgi:hypothetical protein
MVRLADSTIAKWVQRLNAKAPLTRMDLRHLTRALNQANGHQIDVLFNATINCQCPVESKILLGYEMVSTLDGQRLKPILTKVGI